MNNNLFIFNQISPSSEPGDDIHGRVPKDYGNKAMVQGSDCSENCSEQQRANYTALPLIGVSQTEHGRRDEDNSPRRKGDVSKGCKDKAAIYEFFTNSCGHSQTAEN